MCGMFAKIKEAQSTQGGVYLLPGLYRLQINRLKSQVNRKGIEFFAAEMKILWSDCKERQAGTPVSWLVTADKDAALGNVKAFLEKVFEAKMQEAGVASIGEPIVIDETTAQEAVSEEQPLAGTIIDCHAYNHKTQKGADFTRTTWMVPEKGSAVPMIKTA